jgi:ZIP family zinc transporter
MDGMPEAVRAGLWGLLSGSALVIGALLGYAVRLPQRVIAAVMALGSGVLMSAVAFELIGEGWKLGGTTATGGGLAVGAIAFTLGNVAVSRAGAHHRKRSGSNPTERQPPADTGSGAALAIGALLDGIPESVVIGVSLVKGGAVSVATVAAIFLSNLPEGLSSAAGMRQAGHSRGYVFGLWTGIAVASGLAAFAGNAVLADASPMVIALIMAVAGGAIIAMVVDTMIPEATENVHEMTGLIAALGFFLSFLLSRLG